MHYNVKTIKKVAAVSNEQHHNVQYICAHLKSALQLEAWTINEVAAVKWTA